MNTPHKWDWIDTVAKIAGALGFNSVRVRWKLMRWRDSAKNKQQKTIDTISHVGYEHRLCSNCGRLQDRKIKTCTNCGHKMAPRFVELLNRIGFVSPQFLSVTSLLIVAMIVCFVQLVWGPDAFKHIISPDSVALIRHGANFSPLILASEWWRLATCIFLHIGFFHLLFNLIALEQIGPEIEQIFGRGRFLFLFMLTGILASLASFAWHQYVTHTIVFSAGASGAIMGLIGVAAAWGHKDGTSIGRSVRNTMLKWAAYTMIFGLFIGADNVAHAGGFIAGAAIGLIMKPKRVRQSSLGAVALGFLGLAAALATVFLVLFPPHSTELQMILDVWS